MTESRGNSLANAAEAMAIINSCRSFLASMTPGSEYQLILDQRIGAHARLLVIPISVDTDHVFGYLHLVNGEWSVLGVGSFFDLDFYEEHEIPEALHI